MLGDNAVECPLDAVLIDNVHDKRDDLVPHPFQSRDALFHAGFDHVGKNDERTLACKCRAEFNAHSAGAAGYHDHLVFKSFHDALHSAGHQVEVHLRGQRPFQCTTQASSALIITLSSRPIAPMRTMPMNTAEMRKVSAASEMI